MAAYCMDSCAHFAPQGLPYGVLTNESIQKHADLSDLGLGPDRKLLLSPLSPDMAKAIEHCHAIAKSAFRARLRKLSSRRLKPEDYWHELHNVWMTSITKEMVAKDVESLYGTYAAIIAKGGDWPPKKFR
jgi:hypothetical protein